MAVKKRLVRRKTTPVRKRVTRLTRRLHKTAPLASPPLVVTPPPGLIAHLLAASRAAHQRSFQHRGRIDKTGKVSVPPRLHAAGQDTREALRLRLEAHASDPQHTDPAWLTDTEANKGVSHDAMVVFLGRYLTPVGARLVAVVAVMVILAGCGSNPTAPSPQPPPEPPRVTLRMVDADTGASLGTQAATVRLPALVPVLMAGYVTHDAWITADGQQIALIPEAGFDLAFYRRMARNGLEAPDHLEPLRILDQSLDIYLEPGLSASTIAALHQVALRIVPALTGGRLNVTGFQVGTMPAQPSRVVVHLVNELEGIGCGRALVGGAEIWLNIVPRCAFGSAQIDPGTFAHELGHILGFWHDGDTLMRSGRILGTSDPSALERRHAAYAYARQSGNMDLDRDAVGRVGFAAVLAE